MKTYLKHSSRPYVFARDFRYRYPNPMPAHHTVAIFQRVSLSFVPCHWSLLVIGPWSLVICENWSLAFRFLLRALRHKIEAVFIPQLLAGHVDNFLHVAAEVRDGAQ